MSEKTQCCKDVYLFKLIYILSVMSIRILMDHCGKYAQMILKLFWENKSTISPASPPGEVKVWPG